MIFTDRQGISAGNVPRGWQAETRKNAHAAFDQFVDTFEANYPKATECLIHWLTGQCAAMSREVRIVMNC